VAEAWRLRREARRCAYNAMSAEHPGERRMFESLSLFYGVLGETEPDEGRRGTARALTGSRPGDGPALLHKLRHVERA